MSAKVSLRIAAVIMLLHDIGHTIGHLTWRQTPDLSRRDVINQMSSNRLPFMGAIRSLADYFEGYGWASTLALLFFAAVLWIISGFEEPGRRMAAKIALAASSILLLWGIDEFIYFFPFAAILSILASAFGFYSFAVLNRKS